VTVLAKNDVEVHLPSLKPCDWTVPAVWIGALFWKTALLFRNNGWIMGCTWLPKISSSSAIKGSNGTNGIPQYSCPNHHRTSPVFHCWNQAFWMVGFLGCSPNVNSVGKSMKDYSSDHIMHFQLSDVQCCTAAPGPSEGLSTADTVWYVLHNPTAIPQPSPFQSGTGGELSTVSVALPPPMYCILWRSSPVGKLAVLFGNLVRLALVNPLWGSRG
jgi:hypothetical protein